MLLGFEHRRPTTDTAAQQSYYAMADDTNSAAPIDARADCFRLLGKVRGSRQADDTRRSRKGISILQPSATYYDPGPSRAGSSIAARSPQGSIASPPRSAKPRSSTTIVLKTSAVSYGSTALRCALRSVSVSGRRARDQSAFLIAALISYG